MDSNRLDRRPEARAFSVETLLLHVKEGRIRLRCLKVVEGFDRWRSQDEKAAQGAPVDRTNPRPERAFSCPAGSGEGL